MARLNGQADLWDLSVVCPQLQCGKEVSFKEKFKMLQLVWGLYSKDIQEKVLAAGAALDEGKEMQLSDVLKQVEAMEMCKATQALVSGGGAACRLSEFQKNKFDKKLQGCQDRQKTSGGSTNSGKSCGFCGRGSHERDKCPAKSVECHQCKRVGHFKDKCRSKKPSKVAEVKSDEPAAVVSTMQGSEDFPDDEAEFYGDLFRLSVADEEPGDLTGWCSPMPTGLSPPKDQHLGQVAGLDQQGIKHMRCDNLGRWRVRGVEGHGKVQLSVSVCDEAYGSLSPPRAPPKSKPGLVQVLADTRAQMCVTGVKVALQLGLRVRDLVPCTMRINGANNSGLDTIGGVFLTLSGPGGWETKQMVYVARGVDEFYLSKEAFRELGTIATNIPEVGGVKPVPGSRRRRSSSAPPPPTSHNGLGTMGEQLPYTGVYQSVMDDSLSTDQFHGDDVFLGGVDGVPM